MSKQEFLNFKEISSAILFQDVLNWLNISYQKTDKELKGDYFIVSIEKNLFFSPKNDNLKGSIINFVANHNGVELREAALLLKAQFLSEKEHIPKRDIPILTLEHHNYLKERFISQEVAEKYEVGFVKQRSIMAGRIAFKILDHSGIHIGYIGYKIEDGTWFFPKGFKRPLYNINNVIDKNFVIVTTDPFDTLRIVSLGFSDVVSLLANSMTAEQEEELKKFKNILFLHKEPDNIISRLRSSCFIKAPVFLKPIKEMLDEELKVIIRAL